MENRIKELREIRGWSMRKLAEKMNTSPSSINKLEKGETQLTTRWQERLAAVFEVRPSDIVKFGDGIMEYEDDAERVQVASSTTPDVAITETQFFYLVKTAALDQVGILPGSFLVVETSPIVVSSVESEDVVIASVQYGERTVTLLRQYISPSLLISNSLDSNAPIINLRTADAAIIGIVISSHSLRARKIQATENT